ncbi:ABC transporter permease, partial [Arthrospira platensis SPKY1]|nr:ABC transporter permease [Arthrospira platensis SPKY1]
QATAVAIEIYANPARPISAGVVKGIVQEFTDRVDMGLLGAQVTVTQLLQNGLVAPVEAMAVAQEIGAQQVEQMARGGQVIAVRRETAVANDDPAFNPLAYFAPGMAIIFLMYTVALGGRSILDERNSGALARLLTTPTTLAQVLGGKVLGILLSGVAQVGVLVLGSTLLFGLYWGDSLGVLLLILTVALAATGWGLLLAAFAKTPGQVTNYGTALMLIFGVLGGGFVNLPRTGLLEIVSRITPNAWALDGFLRLHQGGALGDITTELAALVIMGLALFGAAVLLFNRRSESILH